MLRVSRTNGGSFTASAGDKGITLDVLLNGATVWSGQTSLLRLVVLVVGPPIAIWVAWLARRPAGAAASLPGNADDLRALNDPAPDGIHVPRTPDRVQPPRKA
jgi:hypothetical protein